MTNEELKKKMCDTIMQIKGYSILQAEQIADALIAAKIGDVSSEKAMRELAEAFYREKCAEYDLLNYQMQKSEYRIAEAEHRAEVAELVVKNLNDIFTFDYQTVFEQAEKELAEEKNAKN